MAKYLNKPCVDIRITSILISRKQPEIETGLWRTYAVIIGEAIDEDGNKLEEIHRKFPVGGDGPNAWNGDSFEADLTTIANFVKNKYNEVKANYTT